MPNSRRSSKQPSEREQFGIILEEIRSKLERLADGYIHLDQKMEAGFQQLREEMNQRFAIVEQAIKENSDAIKENSDAIKENSDAIKGNSRDIQGLQSTVAALRQDVQHLSEWAAAHEKVHTVT